MKEKLSQAINKYIRPYTFPVAVKIIQEINPLEGYYYPLQKLGNRLALCQGIAAVRRLGWRMGFRKDDHCCPGAFLILGYEEDTEFISRGGFYPIYASTMEEGFKTHQFMPRAPLKSIGSILLSPLDKVSFEPDIVIVYGNSAQIARFIQGILYYEGGTIESYFIGRASCASYIIYPYLNKKCNVIIPGGGERIFAYTDDSELAFAIPNNKFEIVAKGIEQTHKIGTARVPTPYFGIKEEPKFPYIYSEMFEGFKMPFSIKS